MAKNLSLEGGREGEKENVKEKWRMRRPEWNKIKYRIPRVQLTRHLPEDLFDVCLASPQAMPIFFYIYIYIYFVEHIRLRRRWLRAVQVRFIQGIIGLFLYLRRTMRDRCKNIVLFSVSINCEFTNAYLS